MELAGINMWQGSEHYLYQLKVAKVHSTLKVTPAEMSINRRFLLLQDAQTHFYSYWNLFYNYKKKRFFFKYWQSIFCFIHCQQIAQKDQNNMYMRLIHHATMNFSFFFLQKVCFFEYESIYLQPIFEDLHLQ